MLNFYQLGKKNLKSTPLLGLLLLSLLATAGEDLSASEQNLSDGAIANMLREYDTPFILYPYESNYLLTTYASHINKEAIRTYEWSDNASKVEAKFQISLGFPIWRGILGKNSMLGASYTQRSWWQAFNSKESSPFRETNYEPQLFLAWALNEPFWGWHLKEAEIGFNHQSNGRSGATSRSWNRVYGRFMAQNNNWLLELKPWLRIKESASKDDNRDLTKYVGYYRLKVGYHLGEAVISAQGNYNWSSGYGGAELGLSYPMTQKVRIYVQAFSGYGESMIDYNHKQTIRYGLGVMLNDLF